MKTGEPAAPAPEVAEASAPVAEESPAAPTEESKEFKVESAEPPVETKEAAPETGKFSSSLPIVLCAIAFLSVRNEWGCETLFFSCGFFWLPVAESKAVDAPVAKPEHSTLFQKVKKAFEFPKNKNKESPAKEAKEVHPKQVEAPVEPTPAPEAEAAAPAATETTETAVETAQPAAPASDAKPTVSERVSEKVSEGKVNFFNKVKKTFFTKSHSFSGSIPDSKLGAAPAAPPPAIAEVPKEVESAPAPPAETTEV